MSEELSEQEIQSFTSWKLDMLDAMSCDPSLDDIDFRVAFRLMQHMNRRSRDANPSLERLAAQIGVSRDTVRRSLNRMTDMRGNRFWIIRERESRTETYSYSFRTERVDGVLDAKADREEQAKDALRERRARRSEVAHMQPREVANGSICEVANDHTREVAAVQPKHLSWNYLNGTPSTSSSERSDDLHREGVANSYASVRVGHDGNEPLPVPKDQTEAYDMMAAICIGVDVHPSVRSRMMSMLKQGVLTPNLASGMIGKKKEGVA